MKFMISLCIILIVVVSLSFHIERLNDENASIKWQCRKLTDHVEFLEPQVKQWRDAYETTQEVRGAKRD